MFVGSEKAYKIAEEAIGQMMLRQDPTFASWRGATLGQPYLVRSVFKEPSYWIVPVLMRGRVVGFARVLGTGRVAAVGSFCRDDDRVDACPATVTGMTAAEAGRLAETRINAEEGEQASEPLYVHDGPPGREAWLIEVRRSGTPHRWIFVTPAFVYERAAGTVRDEARE